MLLTSQAPERNAFYCSRHGIAIYIEYNEEVNQAMPTE